MERVEISSRTLHKEKISPLIYGEFIEFLNDLIPGLWAELLRDRSFQGQTQSWAVFSAEKDFLPPAWERFICLNTPDNRTDYPSQLRMTPGEVDMRRDFAEPWIGEFSTRILFNRADMMGGILQKGVPVERGRKYKVEVIAKARCVLSRGQSTKGSKAFYVLLGRNYGAFFDSYGAVRFQLKENEWKKYSAEIVPSTTDRTAHFAIALDRPGVLNLGKVSLMPEDALQGWKREIVSAVKDLKPGIIRFGGSSLDYYRWATGIGPRDQRAPFLNVPWMNTEENDVGIDEFLSFCELTGAEPLVCVNAKSAPPEEAAQLVGYCNGSAAGGWGKKRAENGHRQPYSVRYWQVGNELSGPEYEEKLPLYVAAMKKADPSIQILAAFPSERMIDRMGSILDFVCPHFYDITFDRFQGEINRLRELIRQSQNPKMKLGITEWNTTAGNWGVKRAWLNTLWNGLMVARFFNLFHRNCDLITIANRSNMANCAFSGSIQANRSELFFTPSFYVQKLYSTLCGNTALQINHPGSLDCSATRRKNGRIVLAMVNTAGKEMQIRVGVHGKVLSKVEGRVIAHENPLAVNSFEDKRRVQPRKFSDFKKDRRGLVAQLPRHSLTFLLL